MSSVEEHEPVSRDASRGEKAPQRPRAPPRGSVQEPPAHLRRSHALELRERDDDGVGGGGGGGVDIGVDIGVGSGGFVRGLRRVGDPSPAFPAAKETSLGVRVERFDRVLLGSLVPQRARALGGAPRAPPRILLAAARVPDDAFVSRAPRDAVALAVEQARRSDARRGGREGSGPAGGGLSVPRAIG